MKKKWQDMEYRAKQSGIHPKRARRNQKCSTECRKKLSDASKKLWTDKAYRKKITESSKKLWSDKSYRRLTTKKISLAIKKLWQDSEYRNKVIQSLSSLWDDEEYRSRIMASLHACKAHRQQLSRDLWLKPGFANRYKTAKFRAKMCEITHQLWLTPAYREKVTKAKSSSEFKKKMARIQRSPEYIAKLSDALANLPCVSSLQKTLYSILDDLGIAYYREYNDKENDPECRIGPWSFDCVIPRPENTRLLIECQGDFIHNLPNKRRSDAAKATYIDKYCPDCKLKYVWEHEFHNHNKVTESIRYWLGISKIDLKEFNLDSIEIRKTSAEEYKLLLLKYHYLSNAGRGGIAFGGYIANQLISVCVFSPLIRQNINIDGLSAESVCDLSRLCINPYYQRHNFASWFISRCIKKLPSKYRVVIAYCDTAFNHNGSIYKASNFKHDATIAADYWYSCTNGWVMHKKTLYNRAKNLSMTESEYADTFGYHKTWGKPKNRFKYDRVK